MALILFGKTKCLICDVVLNEDDDVVKTSHFIADSNDPLWRFSDSGMHKSCFLKWEHKQDFIKKFNETVGVRTWGNGTYYQMEEDGKISVLKRNDLNNLKSKPF